MKDEDKLARLDMSIYEPPPAKKTVVSEKDKAAAKHDFKIAKE
jgi:hypothetical protein